jgi:hypothetical protein
MSEHHFVIKFNTNNGRFDWDSDTESARFPEGAIYLSEVNKWVDSSYNDSLNQIDTKAGEALSQTLNVLNLMYEQAGNKE